jgi:predicted dehydrogenase
VADPSPKFLPDRVKLSVEPVTMDLTGHAALIREFADAVRDGQKPETDCTNNIKSLAMVFAAVESARVAARVPVQC